jgi:phosphatidylglycerol:prolipoprotein diacylglycerol transferase
MVLMWNLDPVIFSVGPFALRWYSLVYIVGFLLGYWLLVKCAEQKRIKNLNKAKAEELVTWLIIASIVVARLTHVIFYDPLYYITVPWEALFIWKGGMAFHGGLVGAILVGAWFCKKHKVSFYALSDLLVLPLSIMLAFGRIANYINGELVGKVSNSSFCVTYPHHEGCRHLYQFYAAGKNLLTFLILVPLYLREELYKKLKAGTIFYLFFILYGVGRVIADFWRAPDPIDVTFMFLSLSMGQWFSVIMALVGIGGLIHLYFFKTTNK